MSIESISVALLGAGTVGSQVARIMAEDAESFTERIGVPMELVGIAVRDIDAPRDTELPRELLTTDADSIIDRADIVVELMGGIEPAYTLVRRALEAGKSVVTGNKALLAEYGPELYALANESGAHISFEAAVAGAIPIIRPIQDSLSGDRITRILGIVNGTTNYMLDKMDTTGASYQEVFDEAAALGYLEADPSLDVDGHDAAAKAAILASMAFHTQLRKSDVYTEGISAVTAADMKAAAEDGYVIKLLAVAELLDAEETGVSVRVHPVLVPREHPLAGVHGGFNAIFIEAENAGELMFYGAGAGGNPTASAVMGDLVSAAWRRATGGPAITEITPLRLPILPLDKAQASFSIAMDVRDEPGVLAEISRIFADNGVSIETIRQNIDAQDANGNPSAHLRVVTHRASEANLAATVAALKNVNAVAEVTSVLRVEGA
ncbi:homoserine dehydrogenase [Haematomicrobium sanguinis]|uniref:homoserine dehydrogenase n=1 Tax=Haematomicrobium sanguinis TaxID=479106 RepID=UPI0004793F1A|nr:homoserine dehydrogenase [Haematomicrobium sanguinis]